MTNILVYNQEIKSFDLNSIFDYVERKYDVSRNSIKEYLKVNKRIEKCKNDIFFITTCLQNNTMPNFTKFKTTNNRLNQTMIKENKNKIKS